MDWTCTLPGPRNTTPSLFAIIYLVPPGWYEVQLMNQRCDLARADEVEQLEEFTGRCSRPTHYLRWAMTCIRHSYVERLTAKTGKRNAGCDGRTYRVKSARLVRWRK